jgi:hypothetical protein
LEINLLYYQYNRMVAGARSSKLSRPDSLQPVIVLQPRLLLTSLVLILARGCRNRGCCCCHVDTHHHATSTSNLFECMMIYYCCHGALISIVPSKTVAWPLTAISQDFMTMVVIVAFIFLRFLSHRDAPTTRLLKQAVLPVLLSATSCPALSTLTVPSPALVEPADAPPPLFASIISNPQKFRPQKRDGKPKAPRYKPIIARLCLVSMLHYIASNTTGRSAQTRLEFPPPTSGKPTYEFPSGAKLFRVANRTTTIPSQNRQEESDNSSFLSTVVSVLSPPFCLLSCRHISCLAISSSRFGHRIALPIGFVLHHCGSSIPTDYYHYRPSISTNYYQHYSPSISTDCC